MTKIDFYILADDTIQQRYIFACRLAEKAYTLGHYVYIHADSDDQVAALDEHLWAFRRDSFVPHASEASDLNSELGTQIVIGCNQGKHSDNGLLINLSSSIPDIFSRFDRVSEIVIQEQSVTTATRENYRFYRDRGYQLQSHDMRRGR